jgi:hypothetical protein
MMKTYNIILLSPRTITSYYHLFLSPLTIISFYHLLLSLRSLHYQHLKSCLDIVSYFDTYSIPSLCRWTPWLPRPPSLLASEWSSATARLALPREETEAPRPLGRWLRCFGWMHGEWPLTMGCRS